MPGALSTSSRWRGGSIVSNHLSFVPRAPAPRGWLWSRPPRAPAHPTSVCNISAKFTSTTR